MAMGTLNHVDGPARAAMLADTGPGGHGSPASRATRKQSRPGHGWEERHHDNGHRKKETDQSPPERIPPLMGRQIRPEKARGKVQDQ